MLDQNLDTPVNFCKFENNKTKTIKVDSLKFILKTGTNGSPKKRKLRTAKHQLTLCTARCIAKPCTCY